MKRNLLVTLFVIALIYLNSCTKTDIEVLGRYEYSAIFINEGTFMSGNASISVLNFMDDSVSQQVFKTVNSRPIGDVLQSVYEDENNFYFVVNGSDKVEIANSKSLSEVGVINDLISPRYMTSMDDKGFISQWGSESGQVVVVDMNTFAISETINVGHGPEGILHTKDEIWVANSGGFGIDSTIFIINPITNSITDTIVVGDCPREMLIDKDDNIWVLCAGAVVYNSDWSIASETPSKLVQINPTSHLLLKEISLSETEHFSHLDRNGEKDMIYYGGGYGITGIFALSIGSIEAPTEPLIGEKSFYGFNIDPILNEIYASVAPSFTEAATIYKYSKEGDEISTYTGGIGTNGIIFN